MVRRLRLYDQQNVTLRGRAAALLREIVSRLPGFTSHTLARRKQIEY